MFTNKNRYANAFFFFVLSYYQSFSGLWSAEKILLSLQRLHGQLLHTMQEVFVWSNVLLQTKSCSSPTNLYLCWKSILLFLFWYSGRFVLVLTSEFVDYAHALAGINGSFFTWDAPLDVLQLFAYSRKRNWLPIRRTKTDYALSGNRLV